jgi:Spy/CpxP family protein refolding chaperone
MRAVLRSVFPALALALWTTTAWAQQVLIMAPFGPGEPMTLLRQESVQKELKLTPEQITKVDDLSEKMHEKFGQVPIGGSEEEREKQLKELREEHQKVRAENEKELAKILKPEQLKRLKQISYQRQGGKAFTDPEVAKAIQLTGDQKKRICAIQEETGKQVHELLQPGSPPDEETRQKMTELQKAGTAKILKLLTGAQKAKWKELQGEPFKGEILDHPVIIRNN